MNLWGHFMFTPYWVTKELGARLPEVPSLRRKVHVLLLSAGASFDMQVPCEQEAGRSLYFDMESTRQVPWCYQVERANLLCACVCLVSSRHMSGKHRTRWMGTRPSKAL